ncbi:MAG: hypothetical protein ACLQVM_03570 [Terriglobia bacterium]
MENKPSNLEQPLAPEQAAAKAAILAECDRLAEAGITFVAVHFDGSGHMLTPARVSHKPSFVCRNLLFSAHPETSTQTVSLEQVCCSNVYCRTSRLQWKTEERELGNSLGISALRHRKVGAIHLSS